MNDRLKPGDPVHTRCIEICELLRARTGELESPETEHMSAHLAACPQCRELQAAFEGQDAAFLAQYPVGPAVSRVLADADAAAGRRRRLALVLAPVAAALLITSIFLGFWIAQTSIPASGVRTKGPVALEVYIQRDGQISPVAMGERFRPSDRIQFIYSSGIQRYVFLVSLDDGGAVTNFNYQARPTSVPIEPGVEMVLEGSIILDESPHPERVFAVFSMQPLPWREIEEATRSAHDQLMRERQRVQNLKRLPLDHPQATVLLNKAPNRAERGQP